MLIILPFHNGDAEQMQRLLRWIQLLGGCPAHDALIVADAGAQWDKVLAIRNQVISSFRNSEIITNGESVSGWPRGANSLWLTAARWCHEQKKGPWLFLEPDAVPLKAGWADALADAYTKLPEGKTYMGAFLRSQTPGLPEVHMNGVGLYPADCIELTGAPRADRAFDIAWADRIIPKAEHTDLIHCIWGQSGNPPVFATENRPGTNIFSPRQLKPQAVLFHRNKDGSLIRLLEQQSDTRNGRADIVSLRRYGDIINLLPLLYGIREKNRPVRLVVHREFAPLLSGVSYVEPVIWDGSWEEPMQAARQYHAKNAQVFGRGLKPDLRKTNFAKLAWQQIGYEWNRYCPMIFDRRDAARESRLRDTYFRTDKPKVLVKLDGNSSPFGEAGFVREAIKVIAQESELIWLDSIRAPYVYDLLGLMEHAACLVTADTVTHWLGWTALCPMISFVNNSPFGASPAVGDCLLRVPYAQTPARWLEVYRLLCECIKPDGNDKIVLAFSDFRPADPATQKRQDAAFATWGVLNARLFPFAGTRTSQQIGDNRGMPFIRDMIEAAFASGTEDICVFTNNDIQFRTGLLESIQGACREYGCWWSYRVQTAKGDSDHGADCFAFTRKWWRTHQHLFPDFLLGYHWWDDVMVRLMMWSGCSEQHRLCLHEPHPGVTQRLGTPGATHNEQVAQRWLTDHQEQRLKPAEQHL